MDDGFLRPVSGGNVVNTHDHFPPKPVPVPKELEKVPQAFLALPLDVLMWLSVHADIAAQSGDVEVITYTPANDPLEMFHFLARAPQPSTSQGRPQSYVIAVEHLEILVSYHHEVLGRKRNQQAEEKCFAEMAKPPFPQG